VIFSGALVTPSTVDQVTNGGKSVDTTGTDEEGTGASVDGLKVSFSTATVVGFSYTVEISVDASISSIAVDGDVTGFVEEGALVGEETGGIETGRIETGGTETGGTETGRTETGGTETGRTETGRTETGRAETGGTETGRTATGGTETGNSETGITDDEDSNGDSVWVDDSKDVDPDVATGDSEVVTFSVILSVIASDEVGISDEASVVVTLSVATDVVDSVVVVVDVVGAFVVVDVVVDNVVDIVVDEEAGLSSVTAVVLI
jgi:hypothetical protein